MSEPRRVLIVEDSQDDIEFAQRAIAQSGLPCLVSVARDGQEALEALGLADLRRGPRLEALPHLVILDLKMPGLNGFDVVREVRARPETSDLPVVVFSSSSEPRDIDRSRRLGATAYVRKPNHFHEFQTAVQGIVRRWAFDGAPNAAAGDLFQTSLAAPDAWTSDS